MKRKKKIIILAIALIVIFGVSYTIFQSFQPLMVNTTIIEKSNFEEYNIEEGTVKSTNSSNVYATETEIVLELNVSEGDHVKKGDFLVKLDDSALKDELAILEYQRSTIVGQSISERQIIGSPDISIQNEAIELAKRDVDSIKNTLDNNKVLFDSGAISEDEYNRSSLAYTNSLSRLSIEESKLKQLKIKQSLSSGKSQYYNSQFEVIDIRIKQIKDRIEKTKISAPIDGVVSSFNLNEGDQVFKNAYLFNVSGKSSYEIEVYALANKIKTLKEGDLVLIELEFDNQIKTIEGNITFISSEASEIISPLGLIEKKVKLLVNPIYVEDGDLIIGETVDVKLITFKADNVSVVSRDFIFPYNDDEAYWTIENGKSKIVLIKKIHENASKIILDEANDLGIEIIMPPYSEKLEEGIDVSVIKK